MDQKEDTLRKVGVIAGKAEMIDSLINPVPRSRLHSGKRIPGV